MHNIKVGDKLKNNGDTYIVVDANGSNIVIRKEAKPQLVDVKVVFD